MTTVTTPNNADPFRDTIRDRITALGSTISATARAAEVGRAELSMFIHGHRPLRLDKITRVCDALELELQLRPRPRRRG